MRLLSEVLGYFIVMFAAMGGWWVVNQLTTLPAPFVVILIPCAVIVAVVIAMVGFAAVAAPDEFGGVLKAMWEEFKLIP